MIIPLITMQRFYMGGLNKAFGIDGPAYILIEEQEYEPVIGSSTFKGQKHTEESLKLMRSYVKTEEHRDRLRESARHRWENNIGKWTPPPSQKGKRCWTDGNTNKLSFDCPGEGWRLGRMDKHKCVPPSQKGKLWWNNGQINKKGVECPGKGWQRGMLR